MTTDFDKAIRMRIFESWKWKHCDENIHPLWIADMDFKAPEPILQAVEERVNHGVFGYAIEPPELREVITQRLWELYNWPVSPEELVFLSGVMCGINLASRIFARPGDGVLLQTPGYDSILEVPVNSGLTTDESELIRDVNGNYQIDFDSFNNAITDRTRLFILCNPHNPVGRVFSRQELAQMSKICLRNNLIICSDEIHCDIVYEGHKHIPIASLDPEIASATITLMSPGKTFNIPALRCAFAIIQNPDLRKRFELAKRGIIPGPDALGYVAALYAYRSCQSWLNELLSYLKSNRDFLSSTIQEKFPDFRFYPSEATFLAWIDYSQTGISQEVFNKRFDRFFYEEAKVAVYNGQFFGQAGKGFIRLNFGCPRSTLVEGLFRIENALNHTNQTRHH